ncbi:MAG: hypothetical protein ABIE03_06620 [Patescibacteria group bacterium]|nr:hypothetical protein [Patescibacteria group bacterium]
MNSEEIKIKIKERFPGVYEGRNLEVLMREVEMLTPVIKNGLVEFLESEVVPDIEVEGYSLEKLVSEHQMNVLAAFLTLDWLRKEPEEAKKSLLRGHDAIV